MVFYVDSQKSSSAEEIAFLLNKCILQYPGRWSELVFLCIGSDRVTGDCLGPYIGHQLLEHLNTDTHGVYVYGTLKSPVHALNLSRISRQIKILHPEGLVIAVDASLGQKKHLGYVTIADGALYPGAGVQKDLPPVGDIHITGIVNTAGIMEQLTLQTTRLSTVVALADVIGIVTGTAIYFGEYSFLKLVIPMRFTPSVLALAAGILLSVILVFGSIYLPLRKLPKSMAEDLTLEE